MFPLQITFQAYKHTNKWEVSRTKTLRTKQTHKNTSSLTKAKFTQAFLQTDIKPHKQSSIAHIWKTQSVCKRTQIQRRKEMKIEDLKYEESSTSMTNVSSSLS